MSLLLCPLGLPSEGSSKGWPSLQKLRLALDWLMLWPIGSLMVQYPIYPFRFDW
jgi:hypothetical protein